MYPDDPSKPKFPILPIISVDAPRLTQREKYGGLFYLGIAGLCVVVTLVGWFTWSVWTLRNVWTSVYVLHDAARSEDERIQAAYSLSHNSDVDAQQRWDIALRKPLPPLARYLMAESWTPETVRADPIVYAKIVAFSEGWPDWLRLLGVRLMAVAATDGIHFPTEILDHLDEQQSSIQKAWVDYIRAVSHEDNGEALARLKILSESKAPVSGLAQRLLKALDDKSLDPALKWLRTNDPEASNIWKGWNDENGQLIHSLPRP